MTGSSVIIPTLGRMFWVNQLVSSLLHGTRPPAEIIIVDQTPETEHSPVASREMHRLARDPRVRWLSSEHVGAARARNVGARVAEEDVLVFLDDDIFVPERFLEEYDRIFSDPAVDAATGMILVHSRDDGTFRPLVQQASLPTEATMVRGGNFAVRRDVFCRLGGMDERFVRASQHEDWDLAWRLYEQGFAAVWSPGPWCFHAAAGEGGGRWKGFASVSDRAYNKLYFHLRHPRALGSRRALWWLMARQFVLTRGNLVRPWVVPVAVGLTAAAFQRARAAAKAGPVLPLQEGGTPEGREDTR